MPRDIPLSVPEQIRALIKVKWGDIAAFARECELDESSVRNILTRSGAKRARTLIERIAKAAACSKDEVVAIFFLTKKDERKEMFETLAKNVGLNLPRFSEICFGNPSYIYELINRESSGLQVRQLMDLVNALGLDLDSFEQLFADKVEAA